MANFDEESMRTECFDIMDELKASLAKAKPGSEEHSRIIKDISVMAGVIHKDYEIGMTIEKENRSAELDERRLEKDIRRDEREAEIKMEQAIGSNKWYNLPIVQSGLTAMTATGICVAGMWINTMTENPLKNGISQFIMRPLSFLKMR